MEEIRAKCATFGPGGDIATAAKRAERELMESEYGFFGCFTVTVFSYEPTLLQWELLLLWSIRRADADRYHPEAGRVVGVHKRERNHRQALAMVWRECQSKGTK